MGGSELSLRRALAVSTVATVSREKFEGEIQAPNLNSETGSSGGARAGAIGTRSEVRPRCSRMCAVTCRSVMNATVTVQALENLDHLDRL